MDSRWFKHTKSKEDKEARTKELKSYRNAYEALQEIIEQELLVKDSVRDYGPGWAEKQIALNERNHALKDVLNLINLEDKHK